jgi:hypothetical protein
VDRKIIGDKLFSPKLSDFVFGSEILALLLAIDPAAGPAIQKKLSTNQYFFV